MTEPSGNPFSAFLGGNSVLFQIFLYQTLGTLLGGFLQPFQEAALQDINLVTQIMKLAPADVARLVVRGYLTQSDGEHIGAYSGYTATDIDLLVSGYGNSLGGDAAAAALRRGFIPEDSGPDGVSFRQIIRESDTKDKYADLIKQLSTSLPSPIDAVAADVQSQLDSATAKEYYLKFGGDPDYYDMLYNIAGTPISPTEAGSLANRGLIPWKGRGFDAISFEQAVYEGHQKDKWEPYLEQLQVYLPPPRTVTAMLSAGSFTKEQALTLFEHYGMAPDIASAYVDNATQTKLAKPKDLAETTILALYQDQLIDDPTASSMLGLIGYDANEAAFIIAVEQTKIQQSTIHSAISRIQTLYINRKISDNQALGALNQFGIGSKQVDSLITLWKLERANNLKILTQTEVVDAWAYAVITEDDAISELQAIGYTAYDAWILLSNKNKGALPNQPAKSPTPIENVSIQ